jgi:hypothetical protein
VGVGVAGGEVGGGTTDGAIEGAAEGLAEALADGEAAGLAEALAEGEAAGLAEALGEGEGLAFGEGDGAAATTVIEPVIVGCTWHPKDIVVAEGRVVEAVHGPTPKLPPGGPAAQPPTPHLNTPAAKALWGTTVSGFVKVTVPPAMIVAEPGDQAKVPAAVVVAVNVADIGWSTTTCTKQAKPSTNKTANDFSCMLLLKGMLLRKRKRERGVVCVFALK